MNYGWATIFTVGAWFIGGFLDGLLGSGALGLNTLFAIIAMGCCIMKFIKDNNIQEYGASAGPLCRLRSGE